MIDADLLGNAPGIGASGDLHSVTVPLERQAAQALATRALAMCTSATAQVDCGVYMSSPHRTVVALGRAAQLSVPGGPGRESAAAAISRFLTSVPGTDPVGRPGSTTSAFGALPFDPRATGEVVIPEMTIVSETEGPSWMTLTGSGQLVAPELPDFSRMQSSVHQNGEGDLDEDDAKVLVEGNESAFTEGVVTALGEIGRGTIAKVVLARRVCASFGARIDIERTLRSLESREPTSTVFAFVTPDGTFMGASPELLVGRSGAEVMSVPLAGTVRLTGDARSDATAIARMVESSKENLEHRLVVDAVVAGLASYCGHIEVPADPEVVSLRQVAHLATRLSASLLGEPRRWPSVLELATVLHPTPAVGGFPTEFALEVIRDVEPEGRGFYAGPVGWVDSTGDGEFFIGIRSAEVHGSSASIYAGAGIVAGSDPYEELAETTVKLDTMLGALTTTRVRLKDPPSPPTCGQPPPALPERHG
jgi:menaquinone-specific isochorismate synthase